MHGITVVTALLLVGQAPEATSTSATPDQVWAEYSGKTKGGVRSMSGAGAAAAQSGVVAADVVAEAAQIIGQIVADRASAEAFALVKSKLQTMLGCTLPKPGGQPAPGGTSSAAGKFPFTCQAIAPLRIQDIAASRVALEGALFKDAVVLALQRMPQDDATGVWVRRVTGATFIPVLGRPGAQWTAAMADTAAQEILAYAMNEMNAAQGAIAHIKDDRIKTVVLAGLALAKCKLDTANAAKPQPPLSACAILDVYDGLALTAELPREYYTQGHVIASDLLFAAAGKADAAGTGGGSVVRARLSHGLDALVTSACVLHNGVMGCYPDPQSADEFTQVLVLVRRAGGAVIDRDTNALVVVALDAVDLAQKSADSPDLRRGLQLTAATLQYADTYLAPGTDPKDAHAKRVKILESITQEMTDRTGREADGIWSFGGALRGVGGVRVGSSTAFYCPLALPIGFGYQGPSKSGRGFHFDAGVVDLGQYVSFDESFQVQTPKGEDLLAPSMTVGIYWGKSFPVTLGLTVGYSPHYEFTTGGDRGSFNAGVTFGVYVPLIDLN